MSEEKSILRWGGIAGMQGGIMFILFLVLSVVQPASPPDSKGVVAMFPGVRIATIAEQAVYLAAIILLTFLFIALCRSLRGGSFAPALFGGGHGPSRSIVARSRGRAGYRFEQYL